MSGTSRQPLGSSLAAIALVATTYIYFLLFAQFGFLQGIRGAGLGSGAIQSVLAAMAIAGVAASLATPRIMLGFGRGGAMALGLLLCAGGAASAGFAFTSGRTFIGHLLIAAIGTGAGLGLATVGLAADLRRLTRGKNIGLCVGCATGLAYFVCNIPALYGAPPTTKAWFVAILAAVAVIVIGVSRGRVGAEDASPRVLVPAGWTGLRGLVWVVAGFFALVWFDSAAFAALQLAPATHEHLWGAASDRWLNGGTHAVAATLGGVLLDRALLRTVLGTAMLALVAGALHFDAPGRLGQLAVLIYIAGVSFYSTALAAFAALSPTDRARDTPAVRSAWLYALAGWVGSAAGVGLAEQFGRLPPWTAPVAALMLALALTQARPQRGFA